MQDSLLETGECKIVYWRQGIARYFTGDRGMDDSLLETGECKIVYWRQGNAR